MFSHIGGRKAQEDRFCICPKLDPAVPKASFFGVFDGTVGDFASDNVKDLVVPALQKTEGYRSYVESKKNGDKDK